MTLLSKWKEEDEAIEITKNQDEPDWKAVGSRRGSLSTRAVDISNNNTSSSSSSSSTFSMINERRPSITDNNKWGSFNGFQWEGPSIFDDDNNSNITSKSPLAPNTPDIYDPLFSVHMMPFESNMYKQQKQRSMSFSMGQNNHYQSPFFANNNIDDEDLERHYKSALAPTMEEEEEEDAYLRARSQSSNAVFGSSNTLLSSYWMNRSNQYENGRRPSLGFVPTGSTSSSFLSPQVNKSNLLFQRRMSQPCSTNYTFPDIPNGVPPPPPNSTNSLLGTHSHQLSDRLENLNLSSSTSSKYAENNQNLPQVVYVVEFNSGRKDHYHYTDTLKIGDLVIVEADRGRDLGKIASASMPLEKIKKKNEGSDEEKHIKRIYRQATPDEVSLLLTKKHDEQLALEVCLQKINTRNLPMDVVDAEYQWDRRKLTFYFIADRRIDFRELVRELFKIYKTRIWMCAVNGTSPGASEKQENAY